MNLLEFTDSLNSEMEKRIDEINDRESNRLQALRATTAAILQIIATLKTYVINYSFKNNADEINFFKNIKPRFLVKLLYNQKLFELRSKLPIGSTLEIKNYYLKEFAKLNEYLIDNRDFFLYYKSGASQLDEMYFIRKEPDSWLLVNFENYETDLNFTTIYDHKLSKIMALELISDQIQKSLDQLEGPKEKNKEIKDDKNKITWTSSKVSLIELLYALQSAGAFNNGSVDIKLLASNLEGFFNIDLGNYYRVFQEIRIRKINRTSFLDQLRERLIRRMDDSDENPKFK